MESQWPTCLEQDVEGKSFSYLHHTRDKLPHPAHVLDRSIFLKRSWRRDPEQEKCQPNLSSGCSSCMKIEPPDLENFLTQKGLFSLYTLEWNNVRIHVYVYLWAVIVLLCSDRLSLWDHREGHILEGGRGGLLWRQWICPWLMQEEAILGYERKAWGKDISIEKRKLLPYLGP